MHHDVNLFFLKKGVIFFGFIVAESVNYSSSANAAYS